VTWLIAFTSLFTGLLFATLAQLVEHLICNHEVVGSIPIGGFAEGFLEHVGNECDSLSSELHSFHS